MKPPFKKLQNLLTRLTFWLYMTSLFTVIFYSLNKSSKLVNQALGKSIFTFLIVITLISATIILTGEVTRRVFVHKSGKQIKLRDVIGSNIYKNFGFGFSQMLVLTEGTSKTKIYQSISILIEVSKKMYRPFLVILLLEIIFVHIPTIQQFRYLKIPLIAILFTLSCWKKKRDVLTKDLKLDFLILLEYVTFSTAITLIIGVWNIRIILGVALAVIIGTASPLPFGLGLREILMVGLLKSEVSTTVIIYASAVSRSIQLIIEILIGIPILLRNIKLDRKLDTW